MIPQRFLGVDHCSPDYGLYILAHGVALSEGLGFGVWGLGSRG